MTPARRSLLAGVVAVLVLVVGVSGSTGQQPPSAPTPSAPDVPVVPTEPTPPAPVDEPPPAPAELPEAERPAAPPEEPLPAEGFTFGIPILTVGGADLFYPPLPRGRLQITPSLTLSGEYNDNINASESNPRSEFIGALSPGITLSVRQPLYRILAGYNTSVEFHARDSERDEFGKRHRLFGDVYYQFGPRLSFTLAERFVFDRDTDLVTVSGISTGRRDAYRNTITPSLQWQATPLMLLRAAVSYTLLRYDEDEGVGDDAQDSDTVRVIAGARRRFTQRLSGTLDFGVAYFNLERESEAFTYTPVVGVDYQITPTVRGFIQAGPSVLQRDGDVTVAPAFRARLERRFRWGDVSGSYDRAFTAEGIGVSDRQTLAGILNVRTLLRGLSLQLIPRYTIADVEREGPDRDVQALTVGLRAVYRITPTVSLIGSYTFFYQTSDRGFREYDQNRVFLGLQYAYPINFD